MSIPSSVRMSGPLSVFATGFREELLEQGYRPGTAAKQLQLMAHLSRWLAAHDVEPAALSSAQIERFVKERRASHAQLASTRGLRPLLGYLRGVGVVASAGSREALTPAGAPLDRYAEYCLALIAEAGLPPAHAPPPRPLRARVDAASGRSLLAQWRSGSRHAAAGRRKRASSFGSAVRTSGYALAGPVIGTCGVRRGCERVRCAGVLFRTVLRRARRRSVWSGTRRRRRRAGA